MLTRTSAIQVHCPICLTICSDNLGRIQCSHTFCLSCIQEWTKVNTTCPVCRRNITIIQKLIVGNIKHQTRKLKQIEPETFIVEPIDNQDQYSQLSMEAQQTEELTPILYFRIDREYLRWISQHLRAQPYPYETRQYIVFTSIVRPWLYGDI